MLLVAVMISSLADFVVTSKGVLRVIYCQDSSIQRFQGGPSKSPAQEHSHSG